MHMQIKVGRGKYLRGIYCLLVVIMRVSWQWCTAWIVWCQTQNNYSLPLFVALLVYGSSKCSRDANTLTHMHRKKWT